MYFIKLLPEETIRKISAGEFINRPYSILKELLENSLDANSSVIRIDILDGGLNLIKVHDNGYGISKENLFMSIKRHTTSKIFYFDDLKKLKSFGFRGEALSSISSVSFFSISSRIKDYEYGWLICNNKDKVSVFKISPIVHNVGTIVIVKDVFFNFPIRRKILCSGSYNEWLLLKKMINYFVLANSKVHFIIYNNDFLYKRFNVLRNVKENIIYRIKNIYGNEFYNNSVYVENDDNYISFHGFFSSSKVNKNIKIIFLNKRILSRDNILFNIVDKFLVDCLSKFKYSYILFFKINCKLININVNPDKRKIEFVNSVLICNKVYNNLLFFLTKTKIFNNIHYFQKKIKESSNVNKKHLKISNLFKSDYLQYFLKNFGNIINVFNKRFLFTFKKNNIIITDLFYAYYYLNYYILKFNLFKLIKSKKLLFPVKFKLDNLIINSDIKNILFKLGINLVIKDNFVNIKHVPLELFNKDLKKIFINFFIFFNNKNINLEIKILYWLSDYMINFCNYDNNEVIVLLSKFYKISVYFNLRENIYKIINLNKISFVLSLYDN